jgi:hypothetical protein
MGTQVTTDDAPIKQVWYHTSSGNKTGVRATVDASGFLGATYPVETVELQLSFGFPPNRNYDCYEIQWVERDRDLMLGWHQDDTHMDLGECHFQIDYQGDTVQRDAAMFLDAHPLNVYEQRLNHLAEILNSLTWENERPAVPKQTVK